MSRITRIEVHSIIPSNIDRITDSAKKYLNIMSQDRDKWALSSHLKVFFNAQIRSGAGISDTKRLVSDFEKYYVSLSIQHKC